VQNHYNYLQTKNKQKMSGFNRSESERTQKPLPPEGQHLGLCYSIIDLGTQLGMYQGKPTESHQVQFSWELPKYKAVYNPEKGEQRMAIHHTYNFSLSEKANFRKMMDSWTGQAVKALSDETMQKFIGKPCMIQCVHQTSKDGKLKYANVATKGLAIYKRPADVPFPKETENEKVFFSLASFSWDTFNGLHKFIQEKIEKSKEWPEILRKFPRPKDAPQSTVSMDEDDSGISDSGFEEDVF
jgi:hypothetical protein